eukprot:TRINITY_DN2821_c0_g1_i3.p1 TRINITY_DN2821_c0_g1~~TRINITY_DN2821_c0_g1_i3.p1  ORF type:complete len:105 (-),score=16.03 TRINITY_DN2821_c0_g1_i3:114-428(-)
MILVTRDTDFPLKEHHVTKIWGNFFEIIKFHEMVDHEKQKLNVSLVSMSCAHFLSITIFKLFIFSAPSEFSLIQINIEGRHVQFCFCCTPTFLFEGKEKKQLTT